MGKNHRTSKSEYKQLINLGDNDNWYYDSVTVDNWNRIYDFLAERKLEAEQRGGKNPQFSVAEISRQTGIWEGQVRWSIFLGAKGIKPGREKIIKLIGVVYPPRKKGERAKISNRIELIAYRKPHAHIDTPVREEQESERNEH